MTMPTNTAAEQVSRELLPFVQNPAQYVGGEVNEIRKPWDSVAVHFCLAFPDTYAIGMSHLGSAILYDLLNARPDVLCERVYTPWGDAQARMRQVGIPLFSWESRRPVREFDIVGVSLQYEMLYTNVLAMLDLAGIPVFAAERGEGMPLVMAGGPGVDNPEPMAPFFDLMFLGEAEDALPRVIERFKQLKQKHGFAPANHPPEKGSDPQQHRGSDPFSGPRSEIIVALAREFDCLYAPTLIEPSWNADGTLAALTPKVDGLPPMTRAARVADLENAPFPTRPIVANSEVIHDRINVEIMRGCPRLCRFCESGHTKGHVRYRSAEKILELARAAYLNTGLEEISLASLSPSDHPHLKAIMTTLDAEFAPKGVSLSMPSLRTNDQLELVPRLLGSVRKSGLTMVPEAALMRLRQVIGKAIQDDHLFAGAREAWAHGWNIIKLYFMIGLPTETEEDVVSVARLARKVSELRRDSGKGPGKVNVAVSNFVPKPHTPFQFEAMAEEEYLAKARDLLRKSMPEGRLALKVHRIDRSLLEGVLARGDRRIGRAVYEAWRAGAKFDAWDECLNMAAWKAGFAAAGIDPAFYAHRGRGRDECLPWDRIALGPTREELWEEYEKALGGPA